MTFDVGSRVLYPVHGVADVVGHEHRIIDGEATTYLVLSISGTIRPDDLTLRVPENRLEELGVRDAVSAEEAEEVLEVLAIRNARVAANWSRRFKNHQEKLRSGDIFACAEVVRNLARRQHERKLAPAETAMYRQARHGLVSELAVSWGIDDDDAAGRVDDAIALEVAS